MRARRRLLAACGIGAALVVGMLALAGAVPANVDDMFIVLVYARHLAEHGSIYWNEGAGRVDGFTSVLDMLLKALSILVAPADPLRNANVLTIVFDVTAIALGGAIAYRAARGGPPRALAFATVGAVAAGANLALAQAASYVLEIPLFATAALGALYVVLFRRPGSRWTGALACASWTLLALARPEGGPLALALAAAHLHGARRGGLRARVAASCAAFVVLIGAYHAWHLAYFGYLAPNTFYAKASDSRLNELTDGMKYMVDYATTPVRAMILALLVVAPGLGLVKRLWLSEVARRRFLIASAGALLLTVEVIVAGGDTYQGGRFIATPIALLLAALGVGAVGLAGRWSALAVAPLALFALDGGWRSLGHLGTRLTRIGNWPTTIKSFECERQVAGFIAARVDTASQTDFQRLKYFEERLVVIDLSGLNDVARAHQPASGHDLWGKGGAADGPRVGAEAMQLGIRSATPEPMARYASQDLIGRAELSSTFIGAPLPVEAGEALVRAYVPVSVPVCGVFMNLFVRADRAERFAAGGALVGRSRAAP
jgi:hypothetical protein